ncbi:hypothetical protein J19TS2_14790 [Cohnella xylanilytica]|nr:hypothetical protein J19TS2_14790 [Cohnella xylanilytica]
MRWRSPFAVYTQKNYYTIDPFTYRIRVLCLGSYSGIDRIGKKLRRWLPNPTAPVLPTLKVPPQSVRQAGG